MYDENDYPMPAIFDISQMSIIIRKSEMKQKDMYCKYVCERDYVF